MKIQKHILLHALIVLALMGWMVPMCYVALEHLTEKVEVLKPAGMVQQTLPTYAKGPAWKSVNTYGQTPVMKVSAVAHASAPVAVPTGRLHQSSAQQVRSYGGAYGPAMPSMARASRQGEPVQMLACATMAVPTTHIRTVASEVAGGMTSDQMLDRVVRRAPVPGNPDFDCSCRDDDADDYCDFCGDDMYDACHCGDCRCPLDAGWGSLMMLLLAMVYAGYKYVFLKKNLHI